MPPQIERRFHNSLVTIERREKGAPVLSGYAAVFYRAGDPATEYEIWQGFKERVMPGAFDACLAAQADVRCLWSHDSRQVLGRLPAGTLRLSVDATGLKYEVDLPDTQAGRDAIISVERKDVTGSSFGFRAERITYAEEGQTEIRELQVVTLIEVSPVAFPAYDGTSVGVRASNLDDLKTELSARHAQRKALERSRDQVAVQLMKLTLDS